MFTDHIKGRPRWFAIEPGVVGHRCEYNVFRVTVIHSIGLEAPELGKTYCKCGTLIAEVSDKWR